MHRFYPSLSADCLRQLTILKNNKNASRILPTVDEHMARLPVLSNRSLPLSRYISESIDMMIPQLNGIRHYVNGSWQEALNELYTAVRLETKLVADGNSPTLVFARSTELLAMHLLLMHTKLRERAVSPALHLIPGPIAYVSLDFDQFIGVHVEWHVGRH